MRAFGVTILSVIASAIASPGILLVGDSTVTAEKGWGPGFCNNTINLAQCTNLAVSGKTTVSWQRQKQYDAMIRSCRTPDTYAFIQFATNDQKVMTTAQFNGNLTLLTKKIKNAGCSPVLLTPLARRTFSGKGVLTDKLQPYAQETINVASALNIPHLLLLEDSIAYLNKLGKAAAAQFNYKNSDDTTHLNAMGAQYFGRIVADEVKAGVSTLSSYIKTDEVLSAKIIAGTL